MQKYGGETQQAGAPILGAKFWRKGVSLSGRVMRQFPTINGPCYELELDKNIQVDGKLVSPEQQGKLDTKKVSVGNMKGFNMAIAACGLQDLKARDKVKITATGETDTGKGAPRIDFRLEVERP
jgi:hypothetical protein